MVPVSSLEHQSIWNRPTEFLLNAHTLEDPVLRLEHILSHFLVTLLGSYKDSFNRSKPYNPILGEVFKAHWEHDDSVTQFISEQVSHHPPISANVVYNLKKQFILESSLQFKITFRGTYIRGDLVGKHVINILNHNEVYEVEGPGMNGFGLLIGPSGFEPNGKMIVINKKQNLRGKLKFGKKKIEGKIERLDGKKKTVIKRFKGDHIGIIESFVPSEPDRKQWFDIDKINFGTHPIVKSLTQQEPNESRRVWHNVTYHLHVTKNEEEAQKEKEKIEEEQRRLANERKKNDIEHKTNLFVKNAEHDGVPFFRYKLIEELFREATEIHEDADEALD